MKEIKRAPVFFKHSVVINVSVPLVVTDWSVSSVQLLTLS